MVKRRKIVEYVWFVIIVLLFIASVQMIKSGSLANQIDSFGILTPIIFVLLKISTLVIAPLGGTPLYFIAGSLFGNFYGLALSLLGDALGLTICFLLSRFYGHKIVEIFAGENFFKKVINTVAVLKDSKSMIKARIALIVMPEILAYASGLSRINFLTFFLISMLFSVPIDFMYVFFGSQIVATIAEHTFLFYFLVSFISVAGFWFLYKDYKKLENIQGM